MTSCGALPPKTNELGAVPCTERNKLQPNSSQTTRAPKSEAGKREREGEAETEREKRAGGQEGVERSTPDIVEGAVGCSV